MKKIISMLVVAGCAMIGSAATYIDKVNQDQLGYRALNAGQVAWNDEDGGVVMYVGSPTEVRTLRVFDPAALRGYRYKEITSELTLNSSKENMTEVTGGFKWTYSDAGPWYYEYNELQKGKVPDSFAGSWQVGYAIKNPDGTFTDVTLAPGTEFEATETSGYYGKFKYTTAQIQVISKDSRIQELDFLYTQREPGGMGDMDKYVVSERTITYDERIAYIDFKITYSRAGAYFQAEKFSAKCLGVGDVVQVNDLALNKIYFYDKLTDEGGRVKSSGRFGEVASSGFDLYELRYWAKHLYDGNRGNDWSKYDATNNVHMGRYFINWTVDGATNGAKTITYSHGAAGRNIIWNYGGNAFMQYKPGVNRGLEGTVYENLEIQITAINHKGVASEVDGAQYPDNWTLEFMTSVEIPDDVIEVQWYANHDGIKPPILWTTISAATSRIGTGANGEIIYRAVLPTPYTDNAFNCGFFRILVDPFPTDSKLIIKAGLRVIGTDGMYYDLVWPAGGGAVTATLANDE